jgi:hypothetical protein
MMTMYKSCVHERSCLRQQNPTLEIRGMQARKSSRADCWLLKGELLRERGPTQRITVS